MSTPAAESILSATERPDALRPAPRVILTPEGERALRAELERLRQRLSGEFTDRLREARAHGSSGENDEYLQIKEEEAVLISRLRQLEQLVDSAEVVKESDDDQGIVAVGSLVEVRSRSGAIRTHRITGGFEPAAEPEDVSASSPVGQALLGRSPGEEVTVELPGGRSTALEVVAVRPAAPMARPGPA